MPIYNIPVNYLTPEAPRMLTALKARYAVNSDAEALNALKNYVLKHIVDVTSKYERETAVATATATAVAALPPPISIT